MITKLAQVMVYVENQDAAIKFWTEKIGFVLKANHQNGDMRAVEIAPTNTTETTIVLHDKALIAKMSPELHLGSPSLMFHTEDIDALYTRLKENGVQVGELMAMPFGKVFNFADDETNYFAVMEG